MQSLKLCRNGTVFVAKAILSIHCPTIVELSSFLSPIRSVDLPKCYWPHISLFSLQVWSIIFKKQMIAFQFLSLLPNLQWCGQLSVYGKLFSCLIYQKTGILLGCFTYYAYTHWEYIFMWWMWISPIVWSGWTVQIRLSCCFLSRKRNWFSRA